MLPPKTIPIPYPKIRQEILDVVWEFLESRALLPHREAVRQKLESTPIEVEGSAGHVRVSRNTVTFRSDGRFRRWSLTDLAVPVEAALRGLPDGAGESFSRLHAFETIRELRRKRRRLRQRLATLDERLDALLGIKNFEILFGNRTRLEILGRMLKEGGIGFFRRWLARRQASHATSREWIDGYLKRLPACQAEVFRRLAAPIELSILDAESSLRGEVGSARQELNLVNERLAEIEQEYAPLCEPEFRAFRQITDHLEERVRLRYRDVEQDLLDLYYVLNLPVEERAHGENPGILEQERTFLDRLAGLMAKANYTRVEREALEAGIAQEPGMGVRLEIDLDKAFEQFHFFARGWERQVRTVRTLTLSLKTEESIRFERLAFCLKTRAAPASALAEKARPPGWSMRLFEQNRRFLRPRMEQAEHFIRSFFPSGLEERMAPTRYILKVFLDVGLSETELVLPGTTYRFRWKDLFFIGGGIFGGTVWTILHQLLKGTWIRLLNPLIGVLIAAGGVVRGILGMRTTHKIYQKLREEYENKKLLATGANVIHHFVGEAVEADKKESLLAYSFLLMNQSPSSGISPFLLKQRVQAFLWKRFERRVDFDLVDALATLERFHLLEGAPGEQPIHVAVPRVRFRGFADQAGILPPSLAPAALKTNSIWDRFKPWGRGPREVARLKQSLEELEIRWQDETACRNRGGIRIGRDFLSNGPIYTDPPGDDRDHVARIGILDLDQAQRVLTRELRGLLNLE